MILSFPALREADELVPYHLATATIFANSLTIIP